MSPSTARHFLLRDIRIGRYSVFLPGGINPSSPAEFCFRHDECILYDEMGRQCASSTPPGSWGIRCDLLPPIPETEQAKKVSLQLSNFDFPVAQIGDILTFILHNASDLELNVSLMLYGLRVV